MARKAFILVAMTVVEGHAFTDHPQRFNEHVLILGSRLTPGTKRWANA